MSIRVNPDRAGEYFGSVDRGDTGRQARISNVTNTHSQDWLRPTPPPEKKQETRIETVKKHNITVNGHLIPTLRPCRKCAHGKGRVQSIRLLNEAIGLFRVHRDCTSCGYMWGADEHGDLPRGRQIS